MNEHEFDRGGSGMSDTTQTCIRGCRLRGYHLDDCGEEDCGGCLPREAEPGSLLCRSDKANTIRALLSFGDLAVWIRENVERGSRGDSREVNVVAKAWAPLSIEAITDLDELANLVGTWVRLAVEEHPAGLRGPDWIGARVAPASKRRDADGDLVYDGARIIGVRAGDSGTFIVAGTTWLKSWVDWCCAQDWADAFHDELTQVSRSITAKWPQVVRAKKLPMPCRKDDCGQLMLWMHPPADPAGDATVICHNHNCADRMTGDEFWELVRARRAELAQISTNAPAMDAAA